MFYWLCNWWLNAPSGAYAYKDPFFRGTIAILLGFMTVWYMGPKIIRQLALRKIGDNPEFDHSKLNEFLRDKKNTPTMGGIIILFAIAVCVVLLADLTNYYILMGLFCMVWLAVLGGIDDWLKLNASRRSGSRDGLKSYEKLLFQIGLGVLLGFFIYRYGENSLLSLPNVDKLDVPSFKILTVPFYKPGILLPISAFLIITVLVTTGTSNAVNLTDGMDGLAAGCMVLVSFVFMVLSALGGNEDQARRLLFPYIPHTAELAVLCGAIMGASLGFLWYNCHPAQMFMGDTGSLPLGGLIGYVAIVTRQELMLFIVGGIFVIEAVSVIIQVSYFKWTGGKRFFRVAPIHHHFHLGGWTETQTVMRFWLMSAIFAAIALATIRLR